MRLRFWRNPCNATRARAAMQAAADYCAAHGHQWIKERPPYTRIICTHCGAVHEIQRIEPS